MVNNKVIPIWKNIGMTSYDVIRMIKKEMGNTKVGHCGTLDPFAEGVLVICTGTNTKDIDKFMNYDKEYIATIYLGAETDTLDNSGKIINQKKTSLIDKKNIENVIKLFKGESYQIPPYFSALKFKGVKLYKFARKDIFIRKRARKVIIDDIKLLGIDNNVIKIYIKCKKGTYIRSLSRDIAYKLNTFGYLLNLERVAIGPYNKSNSIEIKNIRKCLKQ